MRNFIRQLNQWGSQATPFLFVIDFELQRPFACRLEDAFHEEIFWSFQERANAAGNLHLEKIELAPVPMDFPEYKKRFDFVYDRLHYGDSFLTNLTIRTPLASAFPLKELYSKASAKYKMLFKNQFLVFSPETFVRIGDGKISAFPMKGTIDASLPDAMTQLLNDKKEMAEHVTIVDLLRNDLSLVAKNVTVERFRYLEKVVTMKKTLWQASSEISGELPQQYQAHIGDILMQLLPAGSVSGAPKAKTLGIIAAAEDHPRGYYTGVFGYFDGKILDSAVAIRYIEKEGNKLYYRSGGGITTQSDPVKEYQEAIDKIYVPID